MSMKFFDCSEQKNVTSIYCNRSRPECHLTGFIVACSDNDMIIQHISPEGRYDGFVLIHKDDVHRFDTNGKYEEKIFRLYKSKKQTHPVLPHNNCLYDSLLEFCKTQNFIISVELEESQLAGFLLDYDDKHVHLQLVNEYGEMNGETILLNDQIISFSVDSEKEQDIKRLNEMINHDIL